METIPCLCTNAHPHCHLRGCVPVDHVGQFHDRQSLLLLRTTWDSGSSFKFSQAYLAMALCRSAPGVYRTERTGAAKIPAASCCRPCCRTGVDAAVHVHCVSEQSAEPAAVYGFGSADDDV